MPELPEVEIVVRGLKALLPRKRILGVSSDWQKSFPNSQTDVDAFLVGAVVTDVKRRAKVIMIELDTGYSLVIHLKMTGQLVFVGEQKPQAPNHKDQAPTKTHITKNLGFGNWDLGITEPMVRFGAGHPSDSLVGKLPDKSTRVIFNLTGARLFFNDQRKFGWVRLVPTAEVPNIDFFKKVGPEPLAADFLATDFVQRLGRRSKSGIKAVLLDQTVVAGVGNIYADESLFASKIHPEKKVCELDVRRLGNLYEQLRRILNLSIEYGGSSDRNYVNARGEKGSYLSFAQVFRRQGQACNICDTLIVKIRVAGRGTHICPNCQKI